MKISIAMATYNGADYILEQLESFVCQSRLPDELVICDDGSIDGTLDIVAEFSKSAPFIVRVYKNENRLGYCQNFCNAISKSTGDIVFLSDQDDVWLEDKLRLVEREFNSKSDVMVVINNQIIADGNIQDIGVTQLDRINELNLGVDWFVTGCCSAIRRPFIDVVLPIPGSFHAHDVWINKIAVMVGVRAIIDKPLQLYRRHGFNSSSSPVSDLKRPGRLKMILSYGLKDNKNEWRQRANSLRLLRERLQVVSSQYSGLVCSSKTSEAIKCLGLEADSIEARINAAERPRIKRFIKIIQLWFRGGYREFNGWKSMLKDIIRP